MSTGTYNGPGDISSAFGGKFIWHPDPATNAVQFTYEFNTADWDYGHKKIVTTDIHEFEVTIQADDFYAMYLNGALASYGWLEDAPPGKGGLFQPYQARLGGDLHLGINSIDIFACNGYPPNPRIAPGATIDQARIACPNPSERVNKYLLFAGDVTLNKVDNSDPNQPMYFITHNHIFSDATWDVRAVDEPPFLSLAFLALGGIVLFGKRRKF